MRPTCLVCSVAIVSILAVSPTLSRAQGAPDTLSFQGFLTDTAGVPITDPSVLITVKLYRGGVAIWEEVHPSVVVTDGFFNILLGGTTPLDTLKFNAPFELGITIDGDPEISPRTPLAAAPYAKALPGLHTSYRESLNAFSYNVVGGAANNTVSPGVTGATIGGGGGFYLTIGSIANSVSGDFGTVAGGYQNSADVGASVAGGIENAASSSFAAVGGGRTNSASGLFSTVPGGRNNTASGNYSFSAGHKAKALHTSTFVWADSTSAAGTDFESTGPQQFLIRAAGGVGIGTNAPGSQLTVHGVVESDTLGFKFPDGSVQTTAAGPSASWSLVGNAGTTPGTNFLGTTDSTSFQIRVNSLPRMTIEPAQDFITVATNVVLGSPGNSVSGGAAGATISGGGGSAEGQDYANEVTGTFGTVGGGSSNLASNGATVGGGSDNGASGTVSTISGGSTNTASGNRSTVGGGNNNAASGERSLVGGGSDNTASGDYSAVPGGLLNTAVGNYSFAAGRRAKALHSASFVWADSASASGTDFESTGPQQFLVRAAGGVGIGTNAPGSQLTVHGVVESDTLGFKFPDGSVQTTAAGPSASWSLVGNAGTNPASNFVGTIDAVAFELRVDDSRAFRFEPPVGNRGPNVIAGFSGNGITNNAAGAAIGGGGSGDENAENLVKGDLGTIGGGSGNRSGNYGTVGGGDNNEATGFISTIAGGDANTADANRATVGGGSHNEATGQYATVSGGSFNVSGGSYSTVPGGSDNQAAGGYSFASGRRAKANHNGSWVWADSSANADFVSTDVDQFLIRASGGVGIGTNAPGSQLAVNGMIESESLGFKFPDGTVQTSAGWSLDGNTGTNPATDFIGTTDSTSLQIRVNNLPRITIEPTADDNRTGTNIVLGSPNNAVVDGVVGATIGGGGGWTSLGASLANEITDDYGTVGGGHGNSASFRATVGGGHSNEASGLQSTISGGASNYASGSYATVGGGTSNVVFSDYATVPGGRSNVANGSYAFAAGHSAHANHTGTFVWADNTGGNFTSTGSHQFLIRATGGVGINTDAPDEELTVFDDGSDGDAQISLKASSPAARQMNVGVNQSFGGFVTMVTNNSLGFGTNGTRWIVLETTGDTRFEGDVYPRHDNQFSLGRSGNEWSEVWTTGGTMTSSDRRLKQDIQALDHGLNEILSLHPVSYYWKDRPGSGRNLGLIAQDARDVVPEVVRGSETGGEYLGLNYAELVPVLIKAIQEQQAIIEQQKSALEDQDARIAMLEKKMTP